MDPARRICIGCGRTLDEIARWGSMSDQERAAIMRSLGPRASSPHPDAATPMAGKMPAVPGR
jgi:predicted Fe-S protein YdhL (DUF1289 family)